MAAHARPPSFIEDKVVFIARGNFGERLKRERELREISVEELSKSTRISSRFLGALESEDWEKLPGGVFGHGFVRTIARYLGLDEEALLAEYDLARADKLPPPPPKPEDRIPSPPKWISAAMILAILLLLIVLFFVGRYAWHRLTAHRTSRNASVLQDAELPVAESQHFAARQCLNFKSSRASSVLLQLNGRALAPLGAPGASGRMVYSR